MRKCVQVMKTDFLSEPWYPVTLPSLYVYVFRYICTLHSTRIYGINDREMARTSNLFFTGKALRGRPGDEEIKRIGKLESEVLTLMAHASKLIKKCNILYTACRGKTGQSQQEAITQWNGVSRKLIKKVVAQRQHRIAQVHQRSSTQQPWD